MLSVDLRCLIEKVTTEIPTLNTFEVIFLDAVIVVVKMNLAENGMTVMITILVAVE